jgi:hypothetical protein
VVASSRSTEDPGTSERTSTSAKERPRTATGERSSSDAAPAPAPAAPAKPAEKPATATKSRAALIAQNNAAFAATDGDPEGQVEPLQEAARFTGPGRRQPG